MAGRVLAAMYLAVAAFPMVGFTQISLSLQQATVATSTMAAATPIEGTVWLQLNQHSALDRAESALYTPGSSSYHHFMTWSDMAPYLPTAAQMAAVQSQLTAGRLTVLQSDAHNLSVRFSGTMADFESTFHTTAEQHTLRGGQVVRAFTAAPVLSSQGVNLVLAVTGVGAAAAEPDLAPPTDPVSGARLGIQTLAQAQTAPPGPYYCFFSANTALLTTPGAFEPDAVYSGPLYSARLSQGKLQSIGGCGYTPAQYFYQTGLDKIHAAGYTGAGQTIAIIESGGSPTLASDLAAFDRIYALPAANLRIIDQTTANNPSPDAIAETTLDVEWAHAVAPDAKIVVIEEDGGYIMDGVSYAVSNKLAQTISVSYGTNEVSAPTGDATAYDSLLEIAACLGINADFSSGDYGDQVADVGQATVNVPSDSPYATGIGGLSQAYLPGTDVLRISSWGNNRTMIGTNGVPLAVPLPIAHGQDKFGGGGGLSRLFPKPSFQAALPGSGRHVPDAADIANPLTGLRIVITDTANCASNPCSELEGGTSLAAPVFSGKWALLNQLLGAALGASADAAIEPTLGQAAPLLAQAAGTPAIRDIVPQPAAEVYGATLTASGVKTYNPAQLSLPETTQPFISALWQISSGEDYVISFDTDSSLAVTPGYDFATGWGELNMSAIFSAFGVVP